MLARQRSIQRCPTSGLRGRTGRPIRFNQVLSGTAYARWSLSAHVSSIRSEFEWIGLRKVQEYYERYLYWADSGIHTITFLKDQLTCSLSIDGLFVLPSPRVALPGNRCPRHWASKAKYSAKARNDHHYRTRSLRWSESFHGPRDVSWNRIENWRWYTYYWHRFCRGFDSFMPKECNWHRANHE